MSAAFVSTVARQVAVKKFVFTLNAAERERLPALVRTGKH